jgi:hypothetical protein
MTNALHSVLGFPTDEQRAAAGLTTQAEFNRILQQCQKIAEPAERLLGEKLIRSVESRNESDPRKLAPYHRHRAGRIYNVSYFVGDVRIGNISDPMTPEARYYIDEMAPEKTMTIVGKMFT